METKKNSVSNSRCSTWLGKANDMQRKGYALSAYFENPSCISIEILPISSNKTFKYNIFKAVFANSTGKCRKIIGM